MKNILISFITVFLLCSCSSGGDDAPVMSGGPEGIVKEELERTKTTTTTTAPTRTTPTSTTPTVSSSYPSISSSSGILWKPIADSGGGLVILLNRSYGNPGVAVLTMSGSVIETGRFVYYSNPDRATYRFSRSGASFPSPCLLKVGSKIWKVEDPRRRYE